LTDLRIGFGVPRAVGDPTHLPQPDHRMMLDYAQRAERDGFDSVWVPDHFFFETRPGVLDPYPEAWTLMTAIGVTTRRVQIGSMVMAAGFRHPALLAKMAGTLQELTGGRVLLGVGAGNQIAEHTAFGLGFDHRVRRFDEYLQVLYPLLGNQRVTLHGHHYHLTDASLLMTHPPVPLMIAALGERMLNLAAKYASAWNGGGAQTDDGEPFRSRLAAFQAACTALGRDPADVDVSYMVGVVVLPDAAATERTIDALASGPFFKSAEEVRTRLAIGTPDAVVDKLSRIVSWGVNHLICSLGIQPFTLWSTAGLDSFVADVLPRLRALSVGAGPAPAQRGLGR
jgi:alkanesulfonate monooxygenase SsuD/methylene tetrahydromethanopterin reductase-like flavin-dependent oxidoreductase (luciferase family)